jgi:hypothetical protein
MQERHSILSVEMLEVSPLFFLSKFPQYFCVCLMDILCYKYVRQIFENLCVPTDYYCTLHFF